MWSCRQFWTGDYSLCECKFAENEDFPGLCDLKPFHFSMSLMVSTYVHKCVCVRAFASTLLPWIPTGSKNMEPMSIHHKEATSSAIWPQSPQEDMWSQKVRTSGRKLLARMFPSSSDITDVDKRLYPWTAASRWIKNPFLNSTWVGSVHNVTMCRWVEKQKKVIKLKVWTPSKKDIKLNFQLKKSKEESEVETLWGKKKWICNEYKETVFRTHSPNRE